MIENLSTFGSSQLCAPAGAASSAASDRLAAAAIVRSRRRRDGMLADTSMGTPPVIRVPWSAPFCGPARRRGREVAALAVDLVHARAAGHDVVVQRASCGRRL